MINSVGLEGVACMGIISVAHAVQQISAPKPMYMRCSGWPLIGHCIGDRWPFLLVLLHVQNKCNRVEFFLIHCACRTADARKRTGA